MKRFLQGLMGRLRSHERRSTLPLLTEGEFTAEYEKAFRQAAPELGITVVDDLRLTVRKPGGDELTVFLNNAYKSYKGDPELKEEIIGQYVGGIVETARSEDKSLDPSRIMPVIKDRAWITARLRERGAESQPGQVTDDLNDDLVIIYVEDSESRMVYFSPQDLEEAGIDRAGLRSLACENLERSLPEIERHGEESVFMMTAGGNYEASLLLLDFLWTKDEMPVNGEIVVAIPSRNILFVTGSQDADGLDMVRRLAADDYGEDSHPITPKLFVRRDGGFVEFAEPGE